MEQKSTMIFINPKFKNAYINPNFLIPPASKIHINPKFLNQQVLNSSLAQPPLPPPEEKIIVPEPPPLPPPSLPAVNKSAIIKNTKRSLIRRAPEVLQGQFSQMPKQSTSNEISRSSTSEKRLNLIKISNTKLVNASQLMKRQQKENETIRRATESLIKAKRLQKKKTIYKLDHRNEKRNEESPKKKRKIIKQYSIRSVDQQKAITPAMDEKKTVLKSPKLLKSVNGDKKKYSLIRKKKSASKKSQQPPSKSHQNENRYFDNKDVNLSTSSLLKNIPERSKTAPILPDFIKI